MQNFSLRGTQDNISKASDIQTEGSHKGKSPVDIRVSGIFDRDGKKMAYVSFADGERTAEGTIPDCVITSNKGFSKDEAAQLEEYMKSELGALKKAAAGINVVKALME